MSNRVSQQALEEAHPAIKTKWVRIGAARIYYQEVGAGPCVILVHGLAGSSRWWRHNIEVLARHFHVYVIDLIGFGRSQGHHTFVLNEAAEYLRGWMDRLGIERAGVVGHSMGGVIAIDLAAQFPEYVRQLVLVDAAAFSLLERALLRNALGLAKTLWYLPLGFLPLLFADAFRAGPWTLWRAGRELLTVDIRASLAQIAAPALIVWGERDWVAPAQIGERLEKELPEAERVVIEGAGHNPMWDHPEAFHRIVIPFLQRFSRLEA